MEKMDELLAKYMLGEATASEIQEIDEWVKVSEDNLKYFTHFKLIWQTSELLKIESNLDPEESWTEFKEIANGSRKETANINNGRGWMKIAAIWLTFFVAAGLVYIFLKPSKVNMLTIQTAELVRIDTLADGSVITLNRNSSITYPDKFTGDTREIKLNKGEAFFNIEHDKKKPFLIHVNDAIVKVVGTSFNIKTSLPATEVIVESGVVQVIHKKVVISLKPKEKVDIDSRTGEMKKGLSADQLYNYYRTKVLVADKTPLWRVVEVLNEAYQANIIIGDKKLARRTLTTTFTIGSLDGNLQVIAETFNVHIVRKPGRIIIQ